MLYVLILLGLISHAKATPLEEDQRKLSFAEGVQFAKDLKEQKSCCNAAQFLSKQPSQGQSRQKILVFVSFSMPMEALKRLSEESERMEVALILRGFVDNSFKRTALQVKDFKKGVDIDPAAFDEYQITKVPTFVLIRDGKEVSRLSGNVSLHFAQEKLMGES